MANISFGERIKRARIQNAMSQEDVGKKIGVTHATISNWEAEKTVPNKQQKNELKRILGNGSAADAKHSEQTDGGPSPLGGWLTKTLVEKGMSIPELAAATALSAPALYNIASGRSANPRPETIRRIEHSLGKEVPRDAKDEIRKEAKIEGIGELVDFQPHDDSDLPSVPGIYVFYDISERPIYVGQAGDIKSRILQHKEKFWFREPIVETGAYVTIADKALRERVETLLIRFLKSNAVINKQKVDRS